MAKARCFVEECENVSRARKMCTLHYQRWKLYGTHELPVRPTVTELGTFTHGTPHGYRFHRCRCDECKGWRREYNRAWNRANKEKRHYFDRLKQLKKYGLTPGDYERILSEQGGVCAVCGRGNPPGRKRYLDIDHSHATGEVRGLLCNPCNVALGMLGDDLDRVTALMEYLRRVAV